MNQPVPEPGGSGSCRPGEGLTPEQPAVPALRPPRLGAVASGALSVLFVSGLIYLPIFGPLVAPLGLIPVARFVADGQRGIRAWGWVVAVLVAVGGAGLWAYAAPILIAYVPLIVLPALSLEAWLRWRWSDGRWAAVTTLAATAYCLLMVAATTWPEDPVRGVAPFLHEATRWLEEAYHAAGVSGGEVALLLDGIETYGAWVLPSAVPVSYFAAVLFWIRPRLAALGFPWTVVPFERYRSEEWLPAAFAASGLGTLALHGTPRWVAVNALIAVLILYFVHGLAIIRAHLARWLGRGWLVRWGVVLLCLPFPFSFVVAGIGIVDSFVELRPHTEPGGSQ